MRPLVLLSSLAPGGAEEVTVAFLRALAEEGYPVPLCTMTDGRDGGPAEELAGSQVSRHDLAATRLLDWEAGRRFLTLLQQEEFDLVHAHGQDAAILCLWARRFRRFRLVVTRHVLEEPEGNIRQRVRAHQALAAFRQADAAVAVSHAAARRLETLGCISIEWIRVIKNGIELDRFDPQANKIHRKILRESLGVGPSGLLVLVPAVLRSGKGHETLLASVPRVLDSIPETRFVLAGEGELEAELKTAAGHTGDAVRFLGHRNDMPALLSACDLVVLPSLSEALPTVAMETAAAGRPLLASRVGGVPEIVADGVTGTLVAPGDPVALAQEIVALLGDPPRRQRLADSARRRAVQEFGIQVQVRRTLELWHEVSGNGGATQ
jgi:glycosyltransferase involved in cell wall biosynthesis